MHESSFSPSHALPSPESQPAVRAAARALVDAVRQADSDTRLEADDYRSCLESIGRMRGQPCALPLLSSGTGTGASVRLADGRSVLDMVSGIGPTVFGHGDPDLIETAAIAAARDVVFQGHVLPGPEYARLSESILRHAGPRLQQVWLSLSGSMANENAWKMILQRHSPADEVLVFEHAFHGRTLAMAELTDRPEYREGLPTRTRIHRVPFFDPGDPDSTRKSVEAIDRALAARPDRIAAMCFECVQGEGGFNDAPADFFRCLMERCRRAGIAVWVDEIQTFGRTGEIFAFRTLGLEDLVDVVTAGKILQGSAVLVTPEYVPRAKLVAGTWAGSTVGMAVGARILTRLEEEDYLGPDGRIVRLCGRIDDAFARLGEQLPGVIRGRSGLGAMQAFVAWNGDPAIADELVETCLEEGVLLQTAGSTPTKIRLLPPLNLTRAELDAAFAGIERALRRVAQRHGLPVDPQPGIAD